MSEKKTLELDDTELKLVHEALATMKLTAQQRLEMAAMSGRTPTQGEMMFLKDKRERFHALEMRVHYLIDPEAARLREKKQE
jgi:hypothetical protein